MENLYTDFLNGYNIILIDSGIEKNTKKSVDNLRAMLLDEFIGNAIS